MKVTVAFLVLSMVVLMAQPSEGFFGMLAKAIPHIIKGIAGRFKNRNGEQEIQQHLDQNQILQQLDQDKQLQQDQLDEEQLEQDQVEQKQLDQKKLNKFLVKYKI
uniref:Uncharacterized protein n=2 Tax=Iconisemion striatum TaxID=60296 RepID=A0A1A7YV35_9TELE